MNFLQKVTNPTTVNLEGIQVKSWLDMGVRMIEKNEVGQSLPETYPGGQSWKLEDLLVA